MSRVTVVVPATVANLGPGFDVLGVCLSSLHDRVTLSLHEGPARVEGVRGRDAELVPTDADNNAIIVAARSMLALLGDKRQPIIEIDRSIPISAGLGSSAAASVAGALGAAAATGKNYSNNDLLLAALEGEAGVAGRHLDNIAPCIYGGVTIVRQVDPPDVIHFAPQAETWMTVLTPKSRLDTKTARGMLPDSLENKIWIQQMANCSALVYGLLRGDYELIGRSLSDKFAEPARKDAIPHFDEMKQSALDAGAKGFGIAGAGPSVFALSADETSAGDVAKALLDAGEPGSTTIVSTVSSGGARCEV